MDNKNRTYQACYFQNETAMQRKQREIVFTAIVQAETLVAAYGSAKVVNGYDYLVYPLATLDNGDSVLNLAKYSVHQFRKSELRNNRSVMSALNRSTWDREDELQDACVAIVEGLTAYPTADMASLYKLAINRLSSQRDKTISKNEQEYNPDCLFCNMAETSIKESFPALCDLVRRAKTELDFDGATPEGQADILRMYENGISVIDIAEKKGINRSNTYKYLYKAQYKVLRKMVELDGPDLPTFALAWLDVEDVQAALAAFKRRATTK